MKKNLFLLTLVSVFGSLKAQNTGSFLLIRAYGPKAVNSILESSVYEKQFAQIQIDSSKLVEHGDYEVLFINQKNKSIKTYKFDDISGLILGNLKDSLKPVDMRYGMGADLNFSLQIADSLVKASVYFFTVPELNATAHFELNFSAQFISNTEQTAEEQYYRFKARLLKDFPEFSQKNMHGYLNKNNEGSVLIYLEKSDFDLKLLDKYHLNFVKKPSVRPRLYELILLESY